MILVEGEWWLISDYHGIISRRARTKKIGQCWLVLAVLENNGKEAFMFIIHPKNVEVEIYRNLHYLYLFILTYIYIYNSLVGQATGSFHLVHKLLLRFLSLRPLPQANSLRLCLHLFIPKT